jgi:c-di-AMP phosphodiesterase-like protein
MSSKEAYEKVTLQDLLIVVDVSRPESIIGSNILDKNIPTVVIDHHKRTESFINQVIMDPIIDITAASATELIVNIMLHNESFNAEAIQLTEAISTIMLSGIYLDTNFFKNKAIGPRSFEAARFLNEQGANTSKAHDLLKEDFEEMTVINKLMAKLTTIDTGVYLSILDEEEQNLDPTMLAKTANNVMDLRGVNAIFVMGRTADKHVKISSRSDGTINVALIMEKLGGGGHHTMAGYETTSEMSLEDVKQQLIQTYKEYQSRARNKGDEK